MYKAYLFNNNCFVLDSVRGSVREGNRAHCTDSEEPLNKQGQRDGKREGLRKMEESDKNKWKAIGIGNGKGQR